MHGIFLGHIPSFPDEWLETLIYTGTFVKFLSQLWSQHKKVYVGISQHKEVRVSQHKEVCSIRVGLPSAY